MARGSRDANREAEDLVREIKGSRQQALKCGVGALSLLIAASR
jgi:hypothetical protein